MYTNRREILCWFQKCITWWGYFEHFLTCDHLNAEKGPKLGIRETRSPFQPSNSNGHNSKNIQDNCMKLYIFKISIKFRVDWCMCVPLKKKLKFGLYLAGIQKVPSKIRWRWPLKIPKKNEHAIYSYGKRWKKGQSFKLKKWHFEPP